MEEVIPGKEDNMPYKLGVLNVNLDTPTQAPDEGWQDDDNLTEHLLGLILVQQYNLKKELELFGERAEEAIKKELHHIHDFGTYIPQDAKLLSREEQSKAFSEFMFIVENRNGVVKARKCAVGSKQRKFCGYMKSEWASTMVSTYGVIINSTI